MTKTIPFRMILAVAVAAHLATVTLATIVMVVTDSKPAEAAFPGENGKIAFVRDILDNNPDPDAENWEIYTMNPDGTNQKNISASDHLDHQPDWSADGTKIAYYSLRDGDFEIYRMNATGTLQTRLTISAVDDPRPHDSDPAYSPDGTKIAFWSDPDGNDSEIYIMGAGGGSQTRLTYNDVDDRAPSWQPLP